MKKILILSILFLYALCTTVSAQTARDYIRQGNRHYRSADIDNAQISYRKAIAKNQNNPQALYNLAMTVAAQAKKNKSYTDSAANLFQSAARYETDKRRQAMSYHNIGVIRQQARQYDQAIDAYKQALRRNPSDNQTRHNLALCLKQQQQQQNQNPQSRSQQQKNKKQQKQDKKPNQQPQQNQQNIKKLSQSTASQLLRAAQREEQKTQQRLQKATQQPARRTYKKNW